MILFIQNDASVPAGFFGERLSAWRLPYRIWHPYAGETAPDPAGVAGAIVLGGTMAVDETGRFPFLREVKGMLAGLLEAEIPQLGICLGGQLLAELLGGRVHRLRNGEHGCCRVRLTAAGVGDPLFAGLPEAFPVFQWHEDSFDVPQRAISLASSEACAGQAMRCGRAWGLQFHPEVNDGIVEVWRSRIGADPEVSASFRRRQEELAPVAERLLRNFLAIAGMPAP